MPTTLPIQLDRDSREPLYRQIETQMRGAIGDGRLRPGTLLPGVRTLAGQLGVARITIVTAYEQLVSEGLLDARVGSGTRVARDARDSIAAEPRRGLEPPSRPRAAPTPTPTAGRRIDLRPGGIRIEDGPGAIWESLLRSAWRELSGDPGGVRAERDRAGDPALRAAIAERVGATRGIDCAPEDVVITAGRRAGLATVAELLLAGGGTAVIEDPADPRALAVLEGAGATVVPVPVDGRGIRTDLLPRAATLARVTPAWQESAGGTLSLDRRLELLAWAERSRAVLVEDDTGGEFRLRGPGIPALHALETGGNVVYIDGIDDVLFDGVQLGYVIAPRPLARRLAERLDLLERRPGRLEQRALAKLLADGHFDRHLRRLRQRLAERQAALVDAAREFGAGLLRTTPAPAGRHLVVGVVEPTVSARTAAARAAGEGVLVQPLALHRRLGAADRDLLVGYSTEAPERIREGVRRLARVIEASVPGPGPIHRAATAGGQRRASPTVNAGPIVPRLAVALE